MDVNRHIEDVLHEVIQILFPLSIIPPDVIKPHAWRDRRYLGEADGKIVAWRGWTANLAALDAGYRPLYADIVENKLPIEERVRLFGPFFTNAIAELSQFVVIYALEFPLETLQIILNKGFTPRAMNKSLHACIIIDPAEFLSLSTLHWAAKTARLVRMQKALLTPTNADTG